MTAQNGRRYLARIMLLAALFTALLGYALYDVARQGNRLELENSQKSIAHILESQSNEMALLAGDNGLWDQAAKTIYTGKNPDFVWDSWGSETTEKRFYSAFAVVDAENNSVLGYSEGQATKFNIEAELGENYHILASRSSENQKAASGIAKTPRGIFFVGVADIMPTSREMDDIIPKQGPHRIIFMRPLSRETLANLGDAYGIPDLHFSKESEDANAFALTDVAGHVVERISWTSNETGMTALWHSFPQILIAFLLIVATAILVARNWLLSLAMFEKEALVDKPSTLPNRVAFHRELEVSIRKNSHVSVAMMDLDAFHRVNARYGHHIGDQLISEVAQFLRQAVGVEGYVARLGGDEFAILINDWDSSRRLESLCEQIIGRFAKPFVLKANSINVGVSIGLSSGDQTSSAEELMRQAEMALHAGKINGKMQAIWFDQDLDQRQSNAYEVESELRAALNNDEITVVYQPSYSVDGRQILAVEALPRWIHPMHGEISAAELASVAEQSGLIERVGMWTIEHACRDALNWGDLLLTINISYVQLTDRNFARTLGAMLEAIEFPASRLQIMVKERYLKLDLMAVERALNDLKQQGVSVALDDYGAGFVSAEFLSSFAFSRVKVHQAVVNAVETSAVARSVLQACVSVAHTLDMRVIADGVDSQAQADLMRVIGCDELQGAHFSVAVSADAISGQLNRMVSQERSRQLLSA